MALEERHLADLHALAAELGIPRYRLLPKARLIEAIRERGGEERPPELAPERLEGAPPAGEAAAVAARPAPPPAAKEAVEAEPVTGILDVMPQRYGFLRLRGLAGSDDDVYISASQIRRCELRPGDQVSGPAREPARGERHRALVHVDSVDGDEPGAPRAEFERLTPVTPTRRLGLEAGGGSEAERLLARAVDLLTPLALGQRVLVSAAPRSGRTTLLRALARALAATGEVELVVLLVDERPEDATAWREQVPEARFASATAELTPAEQAALAELGLARAKRLTEGGRDAVLIIDSLSRLALAYRDPAEVKHVFGAGRALAEEGAGSLTVIATVLGEAGEDPAARAVLTTESALIALDPGLAALGVVPALAAARCAVSHEEELREPAELDGARRLRSLLADLDGREAAALLRERIEGSASNAELLASI